MSAWATSSSPRRRPHLVPPAPVWLAYLLAGLEPKEELKAKQLEKVIYSANLVTWVDEERRHTDLPNLQAELAEELDEIRKATEPRSTAASRSSRAR